MTIMQLLTAGKGGHGQVKAGLI